MCKDSICDKRIKNPGSAENDTPTGEHVEIIDKIIDNKLEAVSRQLDKIITALDTLVEKKYEDKEKIERSICTNVKELVVPYLVRLKNCNLTNDQKVIVGCLESSLNSVTSTFFENLGVNLSKLTPMEIQVADLVKHGKSNKEIADLLCLSINLNVA